MKAKDWIKELESEFKAHENYRTKAEKVVERYEDETDRDDDKFNILWSNIETLHPALFAKSPVPDIRRRYLDKDKDGKQAAEIAERSVAYSIDVYDFEGTVDLAVNDYLLPGMGIVRLRYEPYFETKEGEKKYLEERENGFDPLMNPLYGMFDGDSLVEEYETDQEGFAYLQGEPDEELVYEECTAEPVNWKRFRWQPAARWEDVDWCAIEHYMTSEELEEAYPDHHKEIPLGYTDKGTKVDQDKDDAERALVYEIFDRKKRKNIEIADGYDEILKEVDDPLGLEGYYPFPKPLVTTTKNGKFIPIPDFLFYQDQAQELDRVTDRINRLTEQLKYRGVYDASFEALDRIQQAEDGEFIPVDDFSALMTSGSQGDLNKVMATVPIDQLIMALRSLYETREQIKTTIYEITGIADIMRGTSNANETLGAQQLKTQFGSMRLAKRQRKTAQFVRDIIRLKVEIMMENFDPKTLSMMTGIEFSQEVYDILTKDLMRSYRIDIETDSTITEDAVAEKGQRIELVTAITGFFEKVGPMVQAKLIPANVATELLGFAVRGFKVGRTLEDVLNEMSEDDDDPKMKQMKEQLQAAQQQMQQQAQEQIQQVQQEAGKEVESLNKRLFEKEKALAISNERTDLKMKEVEQKGEIALFLEMFKADLQTQQQIDSKRMDALSDAVNQISESLKVGEI